MKALVAAVPLASRVASVAKLDFNEGSGDGCSSSFLHWSVKGRAGTFGPVTFWFLLYEWRLRASATVHEWRARWSVGSASRGHFVLDRKLENTLVPAGVVVYAKTSPLYCCWYDRMFRTSLNKESLI